jgi:hypothetical protein
VSLSRAVVRLSPELRRSPELTRGPLARSGPPRGTRGRATASRFRDPGRRRVCSREVVHPLGVLARSGPPPRRAREKWSTPRGARRGGRGRRVPDEREGGDEGYGATLGGCGASACAGSATTGSGLTLGWGRGSACAHRLGARRRDGRRRSRRGVRATRSTSRRGGWRSGGRRSRRRRRCGCPGRWTDFPGTSRKTSSGCKGRIFLVFSARSCWGSRKTRDRRK